jgi:hypothetical protein
MKFKKDEFIRHLFSAFIGTAAGLIISYLFGIL